MDKGNEPEKSFLKIKPDSLRIFQNSFFQTTNMKKISILLIAGLGVIACCFTSIPAPAQAAPADHPHQFYLFIGTYARADSNGIFVYRFNTATGKASFVSAIVGIENPSFLNFSPNHRFVYAVSETHGGAGGAGICLCI